MMESDADADADAAAAAAAGDGVLASISALSRSRSSSSSSSHDSGTAAAAEVSFAGATLHKEPSFSRWCLLDDDSADARSDFAEGAGNGNSNGVELRAWPESAALHMNKGGPADDDDATVASIARLLIRPLIYILLWFTFSTCLTLYNKLLLGAHMGNYSLLGEQMGKFPAPLLMNSIHFSMQGIISRLILQFCYPDLRPQYMTWRNYFARVVPTAVATALDIDLSNASLVFITVTFATMCKSSAPVFLLIFAFLFKLETPSIKLLGIILVISFGIMLTVAKSTEFNFWGFLFVMLAAIMSGLRWTLTQILLQNEEFGLTNPFATMSYLAPVMALITAVFSLITEPWSSLSKTRYFDDSQHVIESCVLMLIGGSLAFFMVLCEYLLISATSAVTFTVAGIVKEVVTIVVAVFFFHDQFTILKGVGLVVIIIGVGLFNVYKYHRIKYQKAHGLRNAEQTRQNAKYVILDDIEDGYES